MATADRTGGTATPDRTSGVTAADRTGGFRHSEPSGQVPIGQPARRSSTPPAPPRRSSNPGSEEGALTGALDAAQLIEGYLAELEHTRDSARAGRLHCELARLYERPLGDLRSAVQHYRKSLEFMRGHRPAIRGLRLGLLRRGEYSAALPLFDQEIETHEDSRARALLWYRKGLLLEDRLRRRDAALQAYEAAAELDPSLGVAFQAIAHLTSLTGDYARCDRALATCANLAEHDPVRRSALLAQRAQLLELRLDNATRATEVYEAALDLNPDNQVARQALARLYYTGKRFADLCELLEENPNQESGELRAAALQLAATISKHKLDREPEALAALREAAQIDPVPHMALLQALGTALEGSNDLDALLSNLQQRRDACNDPVDRLALCKQIARVNEARGNTEGSILAYEEALALSPLDREVTEALSRHYSHTDNTQALIDLLDRQLERTQDLAMRTMLLLKKGHTLERHGNADEACATLREALSLEPESGDVFRALEQLYVRQEQPAALSGLYRQRADLDTVHNGERVALLLRVANLEEGPLGKPEAAAHTYRQVLRIDPVNGPALSALQHLCARVGLYDQLVEAIELEVAHTQHVQAQAALLHRAAQVLLEHKQDRKGALSRLQRALVADPNHLPSLLSLERLHWEDGRYEELLATLEKRLERTAQGERIALLLSMSEVAEERLGDSTRALAYARSATQEGPDHPHARRRLIALLRGQGDFEGLSSALQTELEALTSPEQQALCALQIAEIQELRIGDARKALIFYERALAEDPSLRVAFDGWVRACLSLGEYKRLAAELERRAQSEHNPERRRRMRIWAAEIHAQYMGNVKQAKTLLQQTSQERPLPLDVLLLQEGIEQRVGNSDDLWQVLQARTRQSSDEQGKAAAIHHLLRICSREDCSEPEQRRIGLIQNLHELGIADVDNLEELQVLLLERGAPEKLPPLDQAIDELSQDPMLRATHLCHFAESYEDTDPYAAEDTYMRALTLDHQCLGAVRGLGRLALRGKDPEALSKAASQETEVGGNAMLAGSYYRRAANLLIAQVQEAQDPQTQEVQEARAEAARMLERALECEPDNAEVADGLMTLMRNGELVHQLLDTLRRAAECATHPERTRDLWLRMSELQLNDLDNAAGALVCARKAVDATPAHLPALLALARLQRRNRRAEEAAELLRKALHKVPAGTPAEMVRDVHLELATIYEEHLEDPQKAVECLLAADPLDGSRSSVLSRLARLQARCGDHDEAIQTASRFLQQAQNSSVRAEAYLLLAETRQSAGDAAGAEASLYEAIVEVGPLSNAGEALKARLRDSQQAATTDVTDAAPAQEPLDSRDNSYVQAILRYCESAAEPQVTSALLAAADFQAQVLGDPAAACETLQTVDVAAHQSLRASLATYLHQAGEHTKAIGHLRQLIQRSPWEPSYLHLLYAAQHALGDAGAAAASAEVLQILEHATEAQLQVIEAVRTAPRPQNQQPPLEHLRNTVGDVKHGLVIEQLLVALRPAYPRLFSTGFDGYNLDGQAPLNQTPDHPLMRLANHMARQFGAPDFNLYLHRARSQWVTFEVDEPGAILVPSHVRELSPAAQRYVLTQPILALAMGLELTLKLTPRELQILLSAACRQVVRTYGDGLTSEDVLEHQSRQIQRGLPRRNRKQLEPLLYAYMDLGAQDLESWVHDRHRGLQQIAALAANDLPFVVQQIRKSDRLLEDLTPQALIKQCEQANSIIRYWLTEGATHARPFLAS